MKLNVLVAAVAAVIALSGVALAQSGPLLTGKQIMEEWGDKILEAKNTNGRKFSTRFGKDGKASVSGDVVDTGTWRVTDDGYCAMWQKIRSGQEACFKVQRDGAAYKILFQDGKLSATASLK